MAKHKGKAKRVMHAGTRNKVEETKENPFEVRINKRRYDILGRKIKHEKGKPGVSRSRGLKKRERTLLVEYKQRNKANTFVDKRFGEYDETLSLEEKMLKRFATEKQRHHERSGLFNLEDEELTHFGQSLNEIKHFDGPILSDDEQDDIMSEGHFGGFLKRKAQDAGKANDEPRSKKEIMEEVVANAKIKKHERQVAKEETEMMRQKLDEGLDSIRSLLTFRGDGSESQPKQKADDYDIVVREMGFEMKAQATDKLKTEEQLARIEEEKLQNLESERIRRMNGLLHEEKKPTHISADDLLDCYAVDTDNRSLLAYHDGKMVVPDDYDENSDEDMEEDCEQEDDSDDDKNDSDGKEDEDDSKESDIESSSESSDDEMDESRPVKADHHVDSSGPRSDGGTTKMSPTTDDLPYTFKAPKAYEEFHKLVGARSTSDMFKIVERIQKCNHPKLNPGNKVKMEVFFDILIKYVDELLSQTTSKLRTVDGLICHLFNLAQHSPVHTAKTMQNILKESQKRFCQSSRKRRVPDLRTLLYLRIISVLFPTSDFRHGVCTPALTFMGQILSQITVQSVGDSFVGLFVCNLVYEFVQTSKRYVPEAINYLIGIIYLFSEKNDHDGKLFPPFKTRSKYKHVLKISSGTTPSSEPKPINLSKIFTDDLENDNNTALYTCLVVLKKFLVIYADLVSYPEIFEPVVYHMNRITISNYSSKTQNLHADVLETMTSHVTKRQPLALQTRRPAAIQMFEPKFDEHYEVKRKHSGGNKNVNERQKLRYKHKKEFKGALREIRKDSQFLARQQLQEQLQRDSERAQKTKEIQAMLSNQQAEANAFNRKSRKNRN